MNNHLDLRKLNNITIANTKREKAKNIEKIFREETDLSIFINQQRNRNLGKRFKNVKVFVCLDLELL